MKNIKKVKASHTFYRALGPELSQCTGSQSAGDYKSSTGGRLLLHSFRCSDHLCKLDKKYLNLPICKLYIFSGQNSETFGISHAFLTMVAKLLTLKNNLFFIAHPALSYVVCVIINKLAKINNRQMLMDGVSK